MREIIYLGRDNRIDWQLRADGVAVDLASVARMVVVIGGHTIDSAENGGNGPGNPIHWTGGIPADDVPNLYLQLGNVLQDAQAAEVRGNMRLIIYDPDHPNGLVWDDVPGQIVA